MALNCTVGGTKGTFAEPVAREVAGVLDHAFGAEGDWEGVAPQRFGALAGPGWVDLQRRATAELGAEAVPNLSALGVEGRGVYLPAPVQAIALPMPDGGPLRCASLPGLREELAELAERWDLPLDDGGLAELIRIHCDPDDGFVAETPEILAFAQLSLAANEAVRRDCPLWLVGEPPGVTT